MNEAGDGGPGWSRDGEAQRRETAPDPGADGAGWKQRPRRKMTRGHRKRQQASAQEMGDEGPGGAPWEEAEAAWKTAEKMALKRRCTGRVERDATPREPAQNGRRGGP